MTRTEYIAHVQAQGGFWSAYRRGYLASLSGDDETSNPFHAPHIYAWDWRRGYTHASAGLSPVW